MGFAHHEASFAAKKMKQENTTCRRPTGVKKSGSSAMNRVPRQGDTGCRLKFQSSASLYLKRLTTRACYTNLELFCCLTLAESDQGTDELLERAHQRPWDPFHHSFTIGKVLGRILPNCGLWKESKFLTGRISKCAPSRKMWQQVQSAIEKALALARGPKSNLNF